MLTFFLFLVDESELIASERKF